MKNLQQLKQAMIEEAPEVMENGQWSSSLPTFGGGEPSDTMGVWSWDAKYLLVGSCADDLEIIKRS